MDLEKYSVREKQVIKYLLMGLTNANVGVILHVSEKCIKSHLHRIFKKAGVKRRPEFMAMAAGTYVPMGEALREARRDRNTLPSGIF